MKFSDETEAQLRELDAASNPAPPTPPQRKPKHAPPPPARKPWVWSLEESLAEAAKKKEQEVIEVGLGPLAPHMVKWFREQGYFTAEQSVESRSYWSPSLAAELYGPDPDHPGGFREMDRALEAVNGMLLRKEITAEEHEAAIKAIGEKAHVLRLAEEKKNLAEFNAAETERINELIRQREEARIDALAWDIVERSQSALDGEPEQSDVAQSEGNWDAVDGHEPEPAEPAAAPTEVQQSTEGGGQ